MVTQQIFLPMIPDSAPIVVNISQYDFDAAGYAGRLFFNLVSDGAAYDMDGASAVFQGEKPDGTMFAYPATVVNASVVRVNVRQQMTAVSGRVVCSLVLSNTDGQIGSFNIWLEVQPSSGSGSDPSQTDIPALIAQAKEYRDEAEQAAQDAAAWSANPPYIGANGNWFVYDTATTSYVDTGVYAAGTEGNLWYSGTAISGKSSTPTVYPTGIATARQGDMYLNKTEGAIYQCTLGGADTVAKWVYVMTLSGGGGGVTDYPDLGMLPYINSNLLQGGNQTGASLGLQDALTAGSGIDISALNVISAKLSAGSNVTLTPKSDGSIEIASTGGGGGSSTLGGLSDVSLTSPIADGDVLKYDQATSEWVNGTGGGHNMSPTPNASLTESDVVTAVNAGITEGGINDDVTSLFGIGKWSNTMTKTYLIYGADGHIGTGGIGTWPADIDNPTGTEEATWIKIPALYGIGAVGKENIDLKVTYDPAKSGTVVLGGWIIDDDTDSHTAGRVCVKFATDLSPTDATTATIGIEISIKRTETVDVSTL